MELGDKVEYHMKVLSIRKSDIVTYNGHSELYPTYGSYAY